MKRNKIKINIMLIIMAITVLIVSILFLIFGRQLSKSFHVIGIRIATLFVAFATFCSTTMFSYLIYDHNKVIRSNNDDANKRAALFRDMQFSSDNYSMVNFVDGMTILRESMRYIDKYIYNHSLRFHMLANDIDETHLMENPKEYTYLTLRIPYRTQDGKPIANIIFQKLKFERNDKQYRFVTPKSEDTSYAFLLYNESLQRNLAIINLIIKNDSDFFSFDQVNDFSKIKVTLTVTSILGVEVKGITELYFTNPELRERDGSNTYKINSSMFRLTDMPQISDLNYHKLDI